MIDGIARPARDSWSREQRQAAPCGPRRSSSGSTRAASSITTRRATSARCTRSTSTRTSPRSRRCPTGSSTGPRRASSRSSRASTACPFTWDWTMYRGWYKGKRDFGSGAGAVGVLPRRVERPVPRRPGLPDQRDGEDEPALGGQAVPRRQALAPLGLSVRRRLAARSTTGIDGARHVHHRQLAGLPHLGRVGQLALGVRALLEAARTASTESRKDAQGRLGQPAAARLQPGLHRDRSTRRMDLAFERVRLGPDRRRRRPCSATTCRCWPTSAASRPHFTSKDHNFLPGETVEKQLIVINNSRADGDVRLHVVAGPAAGRRRAARSVSVADRRAGAHSAALRPARRAAARQVRADSDASSSATARRRRTPSPSTCCRAAGRAAGRRRRSPCSIPRARRRKLLDGLGVQCQTRRGRRGSVAATTC